MVKKTYQFPSSDIAMVFSYYAIEKDGVVSTASVGSISGAISVVFGDDATPKEIKAVTGLATFNRGKVINSVCHD